MTREEAKAIIRKEYLCIDRDCDIERSCGKCDLMMPSKEPILQAFKMAMDALDYDDTKYHAEHGEVIVEREVWEDAKRALQALNNIRAEIAEYGSIWVEYVIKGRGDEAIERLIADVLRQAKEQVLEVIDKHMKD